jgi:hypothetical protein
MMFAMLALLVQSPPSTAPAPPPAPCVAAEYRAFDFWVGEWDVFPAGQDKPVATSSIEVMFGGCAIRETWKPINGAGGGSFSHYDRDLKQWRQAWVDGFGGRVDFDGGAVGDAMVLTGNWRHAAGPGKHALTRMTYRQLPDGSVRQHGEQSVDHGLSWATSFDFVYRPRAAVAGDRK